jgi:hypothetical protein
VSAGKFQFYDSEDTQPVDAQINTQLKPLPFDEDNWCGETKDNLPHGRVVVIRDALSIELSQYRYGKQHGKLLSIN